MRNSLKRDIERLMMLDTRYRDSDIDLLLAIWSEHGLELNTRQRLALRASPSPVVVIRRRQELSVKYPPSPMVAERRYKHYREMVDEFSNDNWFKRWLTGRGL